MNISEVCKRRRVFLVDTEVPLLVPSFSSKGFPEISEIHKYMSDHLADTSLVSAYDLYHNFLSEEIIYQSDILFIDSGGYERSIDLELSEIYNKEYQPREWNYELFSNQISELVPLTNLVLVSYDSEEKLKLETQIEEAKNFFGKFPNHASDFLCKPTPANPKKVNIEELCKNIHLLSGFSILGFTEKELGNSVFQRCENIYKIRQSLTNAGMQTPIHIFGCIDPLNVIAYFCSGADIFDGLSWLRFSFVRGVGNYRNSYAITSGKWSIPDNRLTALSYAENLQELTLLMNRMRQFAVSYNFNVFELPEDYTEQLKKLVSSVGIELC